MIIRNNLRNKLSATPDFLEITRLLADFRKVDDSQSNESTVNPEVINNLIKQEEGNQNNIPKRNITYAEAIKLLGSPDGLSVNAYLYSDTNNKYLGFYQRSMLNSFLNTSSHVGGLGILGYGAYAGTRYNYNSFISKLNPDWEVVIYDDNTKNLHLIAINDSKPYYGQPIKDITPPEIMSSKKIWTDGAGTNIMSKMESVPGFGNAFTLAKNVRQGLGSLWGERGDISDNYTNQLIIQRLK